MLHSINRPSSNPLFSYYTVYEIGGFGLGVIQRRFNSKLKLSWWGPVDPWLANDIFENENFMEVFGKLSGPNDTDYPFIEVRKLMYMLGMKPLKKELWEKY